MSKVMKENKMNKNSITVALAGNPNCGKTTIFNHLTGSKQHVGNYAGVTVEKKAGFRRFHEHDLTIVDLPGTYSLTAYSIEEVVTRNFIVLDQPHMVVDVLDSANLERNLYLAVQILELKRPMVLVLNMADVAKKQGVVVSVERLSQRLGVPVVTAVGNKASGMDNLLATIVQSVDKQTTSFQIDYGQQIEQSIVRLCQCFGSAVFSLGFPTRWIALKLLENDKDIVQRLLETDEGQAILAVAAELRGTFAEQTGEDAAAFIATKRYEAVGEIYGRCVLTEPAVLRTTSDKIDALLTHRLLGIPLFLGMMWLVFNLVFTIGSVPQKAIQKGLSFLGQGVGWVLPDGGIKNLLIDGVIGGVGSVLSFVPIILLLFAAIAVLEDSGYMARAAFIMDRVMYKVGLHGKSFIPLLLGFGCSVPAIMGTRTLENPRDRLVTILVTPFMSCSARLPVYTLLCAAFFAENMAGTVLFSVYIFGILLAILVARFLRTFLLTGDTEPFVMEMPPYHWPSPTSILIHMWERTVLYVKKAGTIILAVSVLIWFLTNYPAHVDFSQDYDALTAQADAAYTEHMTQQVYAPLAITALGERPELAETVQRLQGIEENFDAQVVDVRKNTQTYQTAVENKETALFSTAESTELGKYALTVIQLRDEREDAHRALLQQKAHEKLEKSYAGQAGKILEPLVTPLGLNWKHAVSLFAGFSAKEVIVSTLATIYSVGDVEKSSSQLMDALAADPDMNPLVAYTLMIFILIYSPCVATIAVIRRETNSWKWALFASCYTTAIAWCIAFVIYQGGHIFGL
jgi:ferrous iron transport protein B